MLIEAIGKPLTCRWPGGEVRLEPGKPIDLPDDRAQRLLSKAPGKVRMVTPTIAAGSFVTWRRGDGSIQTGFVDVLHADDMGVRWAVVSLLDGTWAVVTLKFLTLVTL